MYLIEEFLGLSGGDPCDEGAEGRGVFPAFDLWDWDCDNRVRVQADEAFDFVAEFGDCLDRKSTRLNSSHSS